MFKIFFIALGGAIGSLCRYWVAAGTYSLLGQDFPYGTLAVNFLGSFVMGLLFVLLLERFNGIGEQLRPLLLIGFLGGFTTFSSFSIETLMLVENGELLRAFANIICSIVLCLSAVWAGLSLGRHL